MTHPDPLLARARAALDEAAYVVPHTDADGLAAGAIALRARGWGVDRAVLLGRGQTPFGDDPPLPPGPAAVLDWGVRPLARPGLIVDHHAPESDPRPDQVLVSGYGQPHVSTSVLMRRVVPDAPAWLAAVGAVGDYGDAGLALPECAGVPKTAVRKLVPLVNAPRRLPDGPVRVALALLVEHDDPRDALKDERIKVLEDARAAWRAGSTPPSAPRRAWPSGSPSSVHVAVSSPPAGGHDVGPAARPADRAGGQRRLPARAGELRRPRRPAGHRPAGRAPVGPARRRPAASSPTATTRRPAAA
jgi:hypothetical protein